MEYLDDSEIRKQVYEAYGSRASSGELDNRTIITKILDLRREKAEILGFKDFADFVLDDRMAKNGMTAKTFEEDLRCRVENSFRKERLS